jgi:hypothetical protein
MSDVLISSERLLDRLGHEVLQLKKLGLVNHAQGMQTAVAIVIKEIHALRLPQEVPPLEPSS